MRLVGDIHGKTTEYYELVKNEDYSLQLGDFGFYSQLQILDNLDKDKHKVLAGNHCVSEVDDDGNFIKQKPHFLGDFGLTAHGGIEFFYIRGEYSIDWMYRTEGYNYWRNEELSVEKMNEAIELYSQVKPDIMISHGCPSSICDLIDGKKRFNGVLLTPSRTAYCLQAMFDAHQPKKWYFGHFHKDWEQTINGCEFRCLAELSFVDV